jgi:hypothetical protein
MKNPSGMLRRAGILPLRLGGDCGSLMCLDHHSCVSGWIGIPPAEVRGFGLDVCMIAPIPEESKRPAIAHR